MRIGINWYKEKANIAIGWIISIALSWGVLANFIDTWKAPFWMVLCDSCLYYYLHETLDSVPQKNYFITKPQNLLIGEYLGLINFPVFVLVALWSDTYLN